MSDTLIDLIRQRVSNPPRPPVSPEQIGQAEAQLGFALPLLLRELYLHVGDGHYGPGYGILGLIDPGAGDHPAVGTYLDFRRADPTDPLWAWPTGMLPICHWGCNQFSCVDCGSAPYPVFTYEWVVGEPMDVSFMPTRDSLEAWLKDWLAGISVFEAVYEHAPESDRVTTNPFTQQPMTIKGRRPRRRSREIG